MEHGNSGAMSGSVIITGKPAWTDALERALAEAGWMPLRRTERSGYVAWLAEANASLIFVPAEDDDWRFWTTTPKSSPATRRIPVIVVDGDEAALTAGADATCPSAELLDRLPQLLALARTPDPAQQDLLARQCAEPLPPEAEEAIAQFNAGEYYRQHDLFEALWVAEPGPVRDLYRSILQVGVAYYQVERGNQRGALKMLLRSLQWLALLPDICQGVDVAGLRADADRVRAELERVGPEGMANFDRSLLKPVRRSRP